MTRRLAVYAHWDPDARVRPYVLRHLQALRGCGMEVHFVSTSPLADSDQERLREHCAAVRLQENLGFDFAMWRGALLELDLGAWDQITLTNSSVLGPVFPLAPILARMEARDCDFWGMTESREDLPHLQSYFLSFRRKVAASERFRRFWEAVLPYAEKGNVIHAYELSLCTWLEEGGFRGEAAFPLPGAPLSRWRNWREGRRFRSRVRYDRNPTLYYPDLLLQLGMPYVKTALLRGNPWKLRLDGLRAFLARDGWIDGGRDSGKD